ncbi:MAG TPA: hypothetical protein V6D14_27170 [Coleofasciculaceae cyanobacterium]
MRSHFWLLSLPTGIGYATGRARWNLGLGLRSAIGLQDQQLINQVR